MHETNGKKKEWKQAVADAAGAGVNLSSTAFHQQAPLKEPNQFDYYVFCAGITEARITWRSFQRRERSELPVFA
jgi:hypothetical protein